MPPRRKWTPEEEALLRELWPREDLTQEDIVKLLGGIVAGTIKSHVERLGMNPRRRTQRRWTQNDVGTLRDLWLQGVTIMDIAKRMDISESAISGKLYQLNLNRSTRGGRDDNSSISSSITLVASCATRERIVHKREFRT